MLDDVYVRAAALFSVTHRLNLHLPLQKQRSLFPRSMKHAVSIGGLHRAADQASVACESTTTRTHTSAAVRDYTCLSVVKVRITAGLDVLDKRVLGERCMSDIL